METIYDIVFWGAKVVIAGSIVLTIVGVTLELRDRLAHRRATRGGRHP